jgi:putative copper resistance protein D
MGAIMQRPWLGQLEHLLYLVTGWLFFVHVFGDEPLRWRLSMPARLGLVVMSMAIDTFVGVILLQSTQAIETAPHPGWGLNPLPDTQMGGGIMWAAGDGLMGAAAMVLVVIWARSPEATASGSWLQRARLSTLEARIGHAIPTTDVEADIDDDDAALDAYNAWLSRLNGGSHR